MGIGLIEQQNGLGIGVKMGEEKQSLLQAAASAGEVKEAALRVTVGHGDFAALLYELRRLKLGAKKRFDATSYLLPPIFWLWLLVKLMAKIPQHLGSLSFAEEDIDAARFPLWFRSRQAGHWW